MDIGAEVLKQFKDSVNAEVLYLVNDSDCARFLRAREMDISKASTMANEWASWYTSTAACGTTTPMDILDGITDRNEDVYTRLCPLCHMGEDKEGCPIYWEQSGLISGQFDELANNISLDDMVTRHIRNQVS